MYSRPNLTAQQAAEVYYLVTEGCPCCHNPMPTAIVSKVYNISSSTVSRIKHMKTYPGKPLDMTIKEKVELCRRTAEAAK